MQPKFANQSARCLAVLSALLLGLTAGCGSADPDLISVIVNLTGVPATAASLSVAATLNGKAAMQSMQFTDSSKFSRFGVHLTKDLSGALVVNVDVFNAASCKLGSASASTAVNPPLQTEVTAAVTLLATPSCATPPPPTTCSPATFCWSNPLPQGNPIRGQWALSASDVWAVGEAGVVLHYDGTAWKAVTSGVSENLYAVWGTSSSNLIVVGEKGRILLWNGTSFAPQTSPVSTDLYGVWGSSASDAWAVGAGGNLVHLTGGSWLASPVVTADNLNAIWGANAGTIYAVGNNGVLVTYSGSGNTWTKMTTPAAAMSTAFYGISGNGSSIFAVGAGGTILSLSGTTWSPVASSTTSQLNAVFGTTATDFWAVGSGGVRVHLFNGNWAVSTSGDGLTNNLYATAASSNAAVWTGGDGGMLLRWNGSAWSQISQGPQNGGALGAQATIRSIYGFSGQDVWAVGDGGLIIHYDGTQWRRFTFGSSANLNSVWGTSTNNMWAVGAGKTIARYDGTAWSAGSLTDTVTVDYNAVYGTADNDVWFVGSCVAGAVNKIFHYNGTVGSYAVSQITYASGNAPSYYSIFVAPTTPGNENVYVGNQGGFLQMPVVAGTAGQPVVYSLNGALSTLGVRSIWGTSDSNLWMVGDSGLMLHWDGTKTGPSLNLTPANLLGLWGSAANDIWAVGSAGTVLRYDGSSWNPVQSGTRNTLTAAWGLSATDSWVTGSSGAILHTLVK